MAVFVTKGYFMHVLESIAHYLVTGHTEYCEEVSHQINICAILQLLAHFARINRLTTQKLFPLNTS